VWLLRLMFGMARFMGSTTSPLVLACHAKLGTRAAPLLQLARVARSQSSAVILYEDKIRLFRILGRNI